jgi:uncharacterized protein (DUF952 family)
MVSVTHADNAATSNLARQLHSWVQSCICDSGLNDDSDGADSRAYGAYMSRLLHLAVAAELAAATEVDYAPSGFAAEGFIHCCWPSQLVGVIERYYQGRDDLVLLELDCCVVKNTLVEEGPSSGEKFPHLYGSIPLSAITERRTLLLDNAGNVDLTLI